MKCYNCVHREVCFICRSYIMCIDFNDECEYYLSKEKLINTQEIEGEEKK